MKQELIQKQTPMFSNMGKKGMSIGEAPDVVVTLVVVGIVIGIGFTILASFQASQTADSAAANGTGKVLEALTNFVDQLPVLGTILIAVLLIGAVVGLFFVMRNR